MWNLGFGVQDPNIGIVDSTGQGSIYEDPSLPSQVSPLGGQGQGIDWLQMLQMAPQFLGGGQQGQQQATMGQNAGLYMPQPVDPIQFSPLMGLFGLLNQRGR